MIGILIALLASRIKRYNILPSLLITVACIACYGIGLTFGEGAPWWRCMVYHVDHANIFHLALNLWALWQFRPRWATCGVAFAASSLAAILPLTWMDAPTCGLSGFLMAAYARGYAEYKKPLWKPIVVNMLFVLFPMFNWKIHLVSFLISYAVWYLARK